MVPTPFTIPELLEKIHNNNEHEIEDKIFAIINYKSNYWAKLVELMFDEETIRKADSKIQFGFVLNKMLTIAELKNGK